MPRVLIPSDGKDYVQHLVRGYRQLGCDVTAGKLNFEFCSADYDLVHLQWPEELTDWRPPSPERTAKVFEQLEYWTKRSRVLLTVHNIYPHGYDGDARYKELLDGVYERVSLIHHYSRTSQESICSEFAPAREQRHFTTELFGYDALLPEKREGRSASRRALGISEQEMVILVFGAIRMWKEVQLVREAYDAAQVPHKRLLMAGRYHERQACSKWELRRRRFSWKNWLRRRRAVVMEEFVPDEEVYRLFDACDATIVPRIEGLSSGIPSLAMTFGKLYIAPRHGAFAEYTAGTGNLLYDSCDAKSMARAIEKAAGVDREAVGRENARISTGRGWDKLAAQFLEESLAGKWSSGAGNSVSCP